MSALKTDGTFTTAAIHGAEKFSCPIEGDSVTTQFEQDYMIAISNYTPMAIGSAHGTHTDHYLIRESPVSDLGGGIGKLTRLYSMIPADRNEYETFAYNFIGFWIPPSVGGIGSSGRDRFTRTVLSRMDYSYSIGIPSAVILAQRYLLAGSDTLVLDYLFFNSNINDSNLSVEDYQALVSAHTDLSTQGIVAEDSRISRWAGNIYERVTRYILPI